MENPVARPSPAQPRSSPTSFPPSLPPSPPPSSLLVLQAFFFFLLTRTYTNRSLVRPLFYLFVVSDSQFFLSFLHPFKSFFESF